jgi:hypothetical protein
MTAAPIKTAGKAAAERLAGLQPGRWRAFVAAAATGTATAVLTYRALRTGGDK